MKTFLSFLFSLTFFATQAQVMGNLLSTWSDSTLVASSQHNNTYNEIWGYAQNGTEYAIIGTTLGTHIIDVTDPYNIEEKYVIPGAAQGTDIVHRDYHDYQGYLYIVADEGLTSSLKIVNLNVLPQEPEVVYDSNALLRQAHNIFIDTVAARLYVLSQLSPEGRYGHGIYDISNPVDPVLLVKQSLIAGVMVNYIHDAHINDNLGFFNCGPRGLVIADMTDPVDPTLITHLPTSEYQQSGYNHSGWPTEDGNYYIFADEDHGKEMKVLDISQLPDVSVTTTLASHTANDLSIPHNQLVHDNKLFASHYYDGLQVYDLTDPAFPTLAMYYPTSNIAHRDRYEGAWGVYPFLPSGNILVSDMQEGLFVIENFTISDVNDQIKIDEIKVWPNPVTDRLINISNEASDDIIKISLLSINGAVVFNSDCQIKSQESHKLTLNNTTGQYLLKMLLSNGQEVIKPLIIRRP